MDDIKRRKKTAKDMEEAVILTKIDDQLNDDSITVVNSGFKDQTSPVNPPSESVISDKVKVSFGKFVQLVATHDFEKILKNRTDEEIVLSSDLLTDLANAHSEVANEDKKMSVILLAGIVIGIVLTYLVIKY